jgi:hypothetical protein
VQQGNSQQQRRAYTRSAFFYMMDWKAFAMEAEALKLDKSGISRLMKQVLVRDLQ